MLFLPYLREKKMEPRLKKEISFYTGNEKGNILDYQLSTFNQIWSKIQKNVPYYKTLVLENKAPQTIDTWEDFQQFPIIDRGYARENITDFSDQSREADAWVTTGGSTGTPLKYPSWSEEAKDYEPNLWYARSFYNISRSDRMFRLWGHSHTLGSGLTKYKKMIAFKIGHPFIGYKRFSAYDLSDDKLLEAGNQIIKFKPNYIIGYSKALRMLTDVNKHRRSEFHKLKLKAVIGAAEGFEKEEDKDFIEDIFGCPVGLEYASMETKILAHTHPDGEYKLLWRNNLVECVDKNGNPSESGRILVTSLYPRAFPLVRYELGDIISHTQKDSESVYAFKRVQGRDNDFLMLDKDTPIHSESITHAIKLSDHIIGYQIRYSTYFSYTLYLKVNDNFKNGSIDEIRKRLNQIDDRLNTMEIKVVDNLKQTLAGKTKWLMKE